MRLALCVLAACAPVATRDPAVARTIGERFQQRVETHAGGAIYGLLAPTVAYAGLAFTRRSCTDELHADGVDRLANRTFAICLAYLGGIEGAHWTASFVGEPAVAPTEPPTIQIWLDRDGKIARIEARAALDVPDTRETEAGETARRVMLAVRSHDPLALERSLDAVVRFEGFAYDDPRCTQRFGAAGEVSGYDVPAFARCVLESDGVSQVAWRGGIDGIDAVNEAPSVGLRGTIQIWVSPRSTERVVRMRAMIHPLDPGAPMEP